MLKNAFKKYPPQNRTNVQIKGGGGQRPFEQCSKKLHFFETMASLTPTNVSRCLFEMLSHVLQLSCSCPQSCLEAANFIKKVRISPCKTFHPAKLQVRCYDHEFQTTTPNKHHCTARRNLPGKRFDISQHKCCLCGLPKSAQLKSIPRKMRVCHNTNSGETKSQP